MTGLKVVTVAPGEDGPFTRQPGTERVLPADLVLISVGFLHPDTTTLTEQLPVELDGRGNVARDDSYATSQDGVFACGDAGRGQSLVVWAIAEGRSCAAAVDRYLTGDTELPAPIEGLTPSDGAAAVGVMDTRKQDFGGCCLYSSLQ